MDAFEPIRAAGLRLHNQLVASGVDANKPLELAKAAVKQLGLELVFLPPGDPALKGARALFDEQGGIICGEDEGDDPAHDPRYNQQSVHVRSSLPRQQ